MRKIVSPLCKVLYSCKGLDSFPSTIMSADKVFFLHLKVRFCWPVQICYKGRCLDGFLLQLVVKPIWTDLPWNLHFLRPVSAQRIFSEVCPFRDQYFPSYFNELNTVFETIMLTFDLSVFISYDFRSFRFFLAIEQRLLSLFSKAAKKSNNTRCMRSW